MSLSLALALGVLALALSSVMTPFVIRICRTHGALDQPDKRKVHTSGIPRMGGVAIFIAVCLMLAVFVLLVLQEQVDLPIEQLRLIPLIFGGLVGFFLIGFLDDIRPLPAVVRLVAQLSVALAVVLLSDGGVRISTLFGRFYLPEWFAVALTVLWIVGVVNTFNWIDGLDGLAGGIGLISALAFLVIACFKPGQPNAGVIILLCVVVIGAILGFLRVNFHPARIFLGDGGAFSLGFLLAVISVIGLFKQAAMISFALPVVILALPIADTAFAILRRLYRRQPVTRPDNRHIHHRILARLNQHYQNIWQSNGKGLNGEEEVRHRAHRNTVLTLYAVAVVFAAIAVAVGLTT